MKMVAMTTLKLKIPWENQVIEIKLSEVQF